MAAGTTDKIDYRIWRWMRILALKYGYIELNDRVARMLVIFPYGEIAASNHRSCWFLKDAGNRLICWHRLSRWTGSRPTRPQEPTHHQEHDTQSLYTPCFHACPFLSAACGKASDLVLLCPELLALLLTESEAPVLLFQSALRDPKRIFILLNRYHMPVTLGSHFSSLFSHSYHLLARLCTCL